MCWLQSNLPKTSEKLHLEKLAVKQLQKDVDFLTQELEQERAANSSLQSKIADRRKKNDEMCALMAMLRSETEAVLQRHNILLDTPEARAVAEDLHFSNQQEHLLTQDSTAVMGDDDMEESEHGMGVNKEDVEEDLDHDGDDEEDDDEEEMFEV
jgi:maltodextrin utilization protein YvdJ